MALNDSFARRKRVDHLFRTAPGRLLAVALDHTIGLGPVGRLDRLVGEIADNGADAVVLHRGTLRHLDTRLFRRMSLVVHLSGGPALGGDRDSRYLLSTVEDALRLGADAVSTQVNIGARTQERQLADLGGVAAACDRWGVPLLAMVYPRGPDVADGADPRLVAHAATVAADLGADLVKTSYPGSVRATAAVTAGCPIPVLVAGGPADGGDAVTRVTDAIRGGAAGAVVGRHVFQSADPGHATRRLAAAVHGHPTHTEGSPL